MVVWRKHYQYEFHKATKIECEDDQRKARNDITRRVFVKALSEMNHVDSFDAITIGIRKKPYDNEFGDMQDFHKWGYDKN